MVLRVVMGMPRAATAVPAVVEPVIARAPDVAVVGAVGVAAVRAVREVADAVPVAAARRAGLLVKGRLECQVLS